MKTPTSILVTATGLALSLLAAQADPAAEVKDAIKKLGSQANYSWTLTPKTVGSENASRQGPIEGKVEKDGLSYFKGMAGELAYEAATKGSKFAVKYSEDWVAVEEDDEVTGRIARRLKAVKQPLDLAEEVAGKAREFKKEADGLYSSEMTAEGAKELFGRLGRRAAEATDAKGSVKFWIKEGLPTKIEFEVKGTIAVGADKRSVEVSRTVTIEIKDVGSTKVKLPEEALKQLS